MAVLSSVVVGCGAAPSPEPAVSEKADSASESATRRAFFTNSAWVTERPMPTPRNSVGIAALDGKIYVVGGWAQTAYGEGFTGALEVFDTATNTWTAKKPMPTARNSLGAAFVGGKLYAIGGWNGGPLTAVEVYDPATDQWSTGAPMPTARNTFGIAEIAGKIYVVGGFDGSSMTAALEVFDPATNSWSAGPAMQGGARNALAAVALEGRLYALGGSSDAAPFLDVVESYDPAAAAWREEPPLLFPRSNHGAAVVDGTVFVAGGNNWLMVNSFLASVESFDPDAGVWEARGPLKDGRADPGVVAAGGTLYVIGGWHWTPKPDGSNEAAATVERLAHPDTMVVVRNDPCLLWGTDVLPDGHWDFRFTRNSVVTIPQGLSGRTEIRCEGHVENTAGEWVVYDDASRPDLACCVVNDWLPCTFWSWTQTISPSGDATLVCSY
jgi:N-acetylneuraminic acid mutarotase